MKLLNLASGNSYWRGVEYYHENRVNEWENTGKHQYQGKVRGSGNQLYDVNIDVAHPRRSTCNCAFADGRRVICKHMVAMYFDIFPEKEKEMEAYIENEQRKYEQELEDKKERRRNEIIQYVKTLSKSELQQKLISHLIGDMESEYERRYW